MCREDLWWPKVWSEFEIFVVCSANPGFLLKQGPVLHKVQKQRKRRDEGRGMVVDEWGDGVGEFGDGVVE